MTSIATILAAAAGLAAQNKELRVSLAAVADLAAELDLARALPRLPREEIPHPGSDAAAAGAGPVHPVVIIPGFVTSSLELWAGPPCAAPHFRSRFWGGITMTQRLLTDKACWLETMALDPETGTDPRVKDGAGSRVRLRAVPGLAGVDYFLPGYGVWARLIEELAAAGYDANTLAAEPYDWRLSIAALEDRDGLFTRMRSRVETMVATAGGAKAFLVAHSWGDNVARAFFAFVEKQTPGWVETHVAHYANIAGPTLGAVKSLPALLSGEARDTAELGAVAAFLGDNFVSRAARAALFRSWPGALGMLPVGGARAWGNATAAPDDGPAMALEGASFGALLSIAGDDGGADGDGDGDGPPKPLDATAALDLLLGAIPPAVAARAREAGVGSPPGARPADCGRGGSALQCPLPHAPGLSIYCLYGVGKPTERAYVYKKDAGGLRIDARATATAPGLAQNGSAGTALLSAGVPAHPLGGVDDGVRLADGDGTVPLLSLGALCARHWRDGALNPGNARVVTRESRHAPLDFLKAGLNTRGGPRSADHVDVLGHADILADVVAIATGSGGALTDRFHSDVRAIAARLPLHGW